MENLKVSDVTSNDIMQLQNIGRKTFFETFSESNTEENMSKYLEEGFSLENLRSQLGDPSSKFYFATLDGKVIGYLKVNRGESQTEMKDSASIEIERIYVLREYHGKKVGQVLYDKAMEVAMQQKVSYVWLGVWEQNPRAISFIKRTGLLSLTSTYSNWVMMSRSIL